MSYLSSIDNQPTEPVVAQVQENIPINSLAAIAERSLPIDLNDKEGIVYIPKGRFRVYQRQGASSCQEEKRLAAKLMADPLEKSQGLSALIWLIEKHIQDASFTTLQECMSRLSEDLPLFQLKYDPILELYEDSRSFQADSIDRDMVKKEVFSFLLEEASGVSPLKEAIAENACLLLDAIEKDPTAFFFAGKNLQLEASFANAALRKNRSVLSYVVEKCLEHHSFARALMPYLEVDDRKMLSTKIPVLSLFLEKNEVDNDVIQALRSVEEKDLEAFWNGLLPLDYKQGISNDPVETGKHLTLVSSIEHPIVQGSSPLSQRYLAKCIHDWLKSTQLEVPQKEALIEFFAKSQNPSTSAEDLLLDYQKGLPIALFTGYQKHIMVIVLHQDHCIICNRGEGWSNPRGYVYYTIDPQKVTTPFLEKILYCQQRPSLEITSIFFSDLLPKYLACQSSPCKKMIEDTLSFRLQKTGNCVYAHTKAAFCLAIFLLQIGQVEPSSLQKDAIVEAVKIAKHGAKLMSYQLREKALEAFNAKSQSYGSQEEALCWQKIALSAEGKMLARQCQTITTAKEHKDMSERKEDWENRCLGVLHCYEDHAFSSLHAAYAKAAIPIFQLKQRFVYKKEINQFLEEKYKYLKEKVEQHLDLQKLKTLSTTALNDAIVFSFWQLENRGYFIEFIFSLSKKLKSSGDTVHSAYLSQKVERHVLLRLQELTLCLKDIEEKEDFDAIYKEIVELGRYCEQDSTISALQQFNEKMNKVLEDKNAIYYLYEDE